MKTFVNNFYGKYKQRIKQIATIGILVGVFCFGLGGLFAPESYNVRQENVGDTASLICSWIKDIGSLLMVISPVILIIADWRNIFPKRD